MPPCSVHAINSTLSEDIPRSSHPTTVYNSPSAHMATAIQSIPQQPFSAFQLSAEHRPRLPPLSRPDSGNYRPGTTSIISPPAATGLRHFTIPSISPSTNYSQYTSSARSSISSHHDSVVAQNSPELPHPRRSGWTSYHQLPHRESSSSLKRSFGAITSSTDQFAHHQPPPTISPDRTDPDSPSYGQPHHQFYSGSRNSLSGPTTPTHASSIPSSSGPPHLQQHTSYPFYQQVTQTSSQPRPSITKRCSLHIRQQPRAARAGPDGKDRRAIDPPPVLQLMLDNFDPSSEEDMEEIRSSCYVVHCRLVSPYTPTTDMSTLSTLNDDGSVEIQRLLLGTAVSSPFFCADDPDIDNMPGHPKTPNIAETAPPSPTSRFIKLRSPPTHSNEGQPNQTPGSFFIFADLSVRKAGEYRIEFALMKIEPATMIAGSRLPIISTVTSQVFRVVNAKDFDQVQPSTELVKGLLDRGAGFPLKLKKGTREGNSSHRHRGDGNGSEDEDGRGTGAPAGSDADGEGDD